MPYKDPEKRKECQKRYNDEHKEELEQYRKQYYKANKECDQERHKRYYETHKEYIQCANREWRKNNRDRRNKQYRDRLNTDPIFKLTEIHRARIKKIISSQNIDKSKRSSELLGCTPAEFKTYIENKFQPGMTWENHGLHGWHLDHIKPLASFDLSDPAQQAIAFHYTNMQPLWAKDNLVKGSKILDEIPQSDNKTTPQFLNI